MSAPIDDDGGPAFPNNDQHGCAFAGMTLRDWLAGQALAGITTQWNSMEFYLSSNGGCTATGVRIFMANAAYAQADAMIAARKGGAA